MPACSGVDARMIGTAPNVSRGARAPSEAGGTCAAFAIQIGGFSMRESVQPHKFPSRRRRGRARISGAKLAYGRIGSGLPVVFVPPLTQDRRIWDRQVAALAQQYEVIRYDVRGFGRSTAGPRTERHAEDLLRLLDVLNLEQVALVGLEEGAEIALELAADHPERVRALVLAAPTVHGLTVRLMDAGHEFPWNVEPPVRTRDEKRAATAAAWRWIWIRVPNQIREVSRLWPLSRRARYLGHWWADESVLDRLRMIAAPTLLVRGEWTHDAKRAGDAFLQRRIPSCTMAAISRSGMLMVLEAPQAFNQLVLAFLQTHYPPSSTGAHPSR